MRALALAVGFLSRLPVPRIRADAVALGRSPIWYPWVGLLLGALAAATAFLLQPASPLLAAAGYSAAMALLSGGLHLDGLGDTADAWVGGHGDRARTLAIMKDPYCGPAAVAAIVVLLLLRTGAAHALIAAGAWTMLALAPALGRAAGSGLVAGVRCARDEGLAAQLQASPARRGILSSLLLAATACWLVAGGAGVAAATVVVLTALALARAFRRRLGGITGDAVGAGIELTELGALLAAALWVGWR